MFDWCNLVEQGSHSGESAPPSTNVVRGLIRARCDVWLSFLLVLVLAPRISPGSPVFLPKNQHSKFQFDQDRGPAWKLATASVASSLNKVICLFKHSNLYN